MDALICYNGDGSFLDRVYQWDNGRVIGIENLSVSSENQGRCYFRFTNTNPSSTISVKAVKSDNRYVATIPDSILESRYNVVVTAYIGTASSVESIVGKIIIPLEPRPKPSVNMYESS